jgi:hypothetical protein
MFLTIPPLLSLSLSLSLSGNAYHLSALNFGNHIMEPVVVLFDLDLQYFFMKIQQILFYLKYS